MKFIGKLKLKAKKAIELKGWSVLDKSFVTKGADPTEMEVYELTKGGDKWELEQFFGDWKAKKNGVPVQFNGNKEKLDEMLSFDKAPTTSEIRKAIDSDSSDYYRTRPY